MKARLASFSSTARFLRSVLDVWQKLSCLARADKLNEAMKLLDEGCSLGLTFTSHVFCALLAGCGRKDSLTIGKRAQEITAKHKAADGAEYRNALLSFLAAVSSHRPSQRFQI